METAKKKYYYTYETTNLSNGKKYIGQHCTYDLNDGYFGSCKELKRDVKAGDKVKVKILAYYDNIFDLGNAEYNLLKERNIRNNDLYYNTHICKYYNYSFEYGRTEATKAKIKLNASRKGRPKGIPPWNKGLTKENNKGVLQMSNALKGHTVSNETRQKISNAIKGSKTGTPSKETIEKIRTSNLGKKRSKETCNRIGLSKIGNSPANKGMSFKFITNGICNKYIKHSEVDEYISKGWILGRISKQNKYKLIDVSTKS